MNRAARMGRGSRLSSLVPTVYHPRSGVLGEGAEAFGHGPVSGRVAFATNGQRGSRSAARVAPSGAARGDQVGGMRQAIITRARTIDPLPAGRAVGFALFGERAR